MFLTRVKNAGSLSLRFRASITQPGLSYAGASVKSANPFNVSALPKSKDIAPLTRESLSS